MDNKIGVGVIGYGYWGPNLARNFQENPGFDLKAVSDLSQPRLDYARSRHPTARLSSNYLDLLNDPGIEAVSLCTPTHTHFEIGMAALKAGKHLLIEKPLASSVEQARQLTEEVARQKRVLLVDHTFIYTEAVRTLRKIVEQGALGHVLYYDAVRVNLGLIQQDINVLWDLAIHDLAIMDYVLASQPRAVSATGQAYPGKHESISYITVFFDDALIAHVHANWLAPVKVRRTLVGGTNKMVVYDDVEPSEKIKIYDKGISVSSSVEDVYKLLIQYRSGDMHAPHIEAVEALRTEVEHFYRCIRKGEKPLTDGASGIRTIQLLEAASLSLKKRGEPVEIRAV
ncbi:MAG: Gfo/Idh/MocA family oxidoreductase [Methylacidiphilales bacterium]|nr:Gfo/Idh/MocA family oxidoreductase [Candidatus Methylacidiphilales bacterium]